MLYNKLMPITCKFTSLDSLSTNGGLGNMMFQIATTYVLALDNNDEAYFQFLNDYYKKYGNDYETNIFRKLKKDIIEIKTEHKYEWNYTVLTYENGLQIYGYFQSYKYFDHKRKEILDLFDPTDKIIEYINKKYQMDELDNTVSVHIRRGDYVNIKLHIKYGLEYIEKALDVIKKKLNTEKIIIFIFSDDIEWCKKNILLKSIEKIIYVENEKTYIDLYLMSMCRHNIIGNSTFSWWGAYLNKNNDKLVVSPKHWFNKSLSTGKQLKEEQLFVPGWIQL